MRGIKIGTVINGVDNDRCRRRRRSAGKHIRTDSAVRSQPLIADLVVMNRICSGCCTADCHMIYHPHAAAGPVVRPCNRDRPRRSVFNQRIYMIGIIPSPKCLSLQIFCLGSSRSVKISCGQRIQRSSIIKNKIHGFFRRSIRIGIQNNCVYQEQFTIAVCQTNTATAIVSDSRIGNQEIEIS